MRWHHPAMNRPSPNLKLAFLCLACGLLTSCAGQTAGERLADMPHWMGGEPNGDYAEFLRVPTVLVMG